MESEKKKFYILIGFVLVIALVSFFYFTSLGMNSNAIHQNNEYDISESEIELNEALITSALYKLGANNLHTPLFGTDTPKLEIIADKITFSAEIINNEVVVKKESIENEDAQIFITKHTLVQIVKSNNVNSVIGEAVKNNEVSFNILASKSTLFSKGYLSLYNKFN